MISLTELNLKGKSEVLMCEYIYMHRFVVVVLLAFLFVCCFGEKGEP